MNLATAGFALAGLLALGCGVGVVTSRNPVHSIVWLAGHLISVALLFLLLGLEFLGLVQVLVYAGAVLVLFLFVVGLLQSGRGPEPSGPNRFRRLAVWGGGALVLLVALLGVAAAHVGAAAAGSGVSPAAGFGSVAAFGRYLFGPYLLPFEVSSLVLLVAIVGVVALVQEEE